MDRAFSAPSHFRPDNLITLFSSASYTWYIRPAHRSRDGAPLGSLYRDHHVAQQGLHLELKLVLIGRIVTRNFRTRLATRADIRLLGKGEDVASLSSSLHTSNLPSFRKLSIDRSLSADYDGSYQHFQQQQLGGSNIRLIHVYRSSANLINERIKERVRLVNSHVNHFRIRPGSRQSQPP